VDRKTTWRERAKSTRDLVLWRTPLLQELVRMAARRGCVPPALWRRLQPRGVWRLHAPDGTCFAYDSTYERDGLARHIVWTDMRDWEAATQPVLFALAKNAEVFVDVGAYSGIYTVLACVANPELQVVAFEPNPAKLPQLRANVAANGLRDRVTIIGKALATECGTAALSIPPDDSTASLREVRPAAPVVDVGVTTGDIALDGMRVDLLKVDVEGLEAEVLMGMRRILTEHRPHIIAECLDQRALARLCHTTRGLGYRHAYHLGHPGRTGPHHHGGLVPVGDLPFRPANYLFTAEPMTGRMMRDA
jgi:FkbM family methyltransferase